MVPVQQVPGQQFSLLPLLVFTLCFPCQTRHWSPPQVVTENRIPTKKCLPSGGCMSHRRKQQMVVLFHLCLPGCNDCGDSSVSCLGLLVPVQQSEWEGELLAGILVLFGSGPCPCLLS